MMMQGCPMLEGGGWMMMIGMGLFWVLAIIALLLAIAALAKYLRSAPQ